SAIRESMKLAFFDMRTERLIAKIHPDNARSLKAFQRCGFLLDSQTPSLKSFEMSSERYLQLLPSGAADCMPEVCMTEIDKTRLQNVHAFEQGSRTYELAHEIERAFVVDPREV